jgi:hypothetical protein
VSVRLISEPVTTTRCVDWAEVAPAASVVCAIAGRATRAPPAIAHEIANGIDFNLNIIKTSPSRISQSGFLIVTFRVFSISLGLIKRYRFIDKTMAKGNVSMKHDCKNV